MGGLVHQLINLVKLSVLFFPLLDIDLKKAAKIFAQKYSCGSSVTGPDEIVIQGDVLDDLLDFIPEKWPEVITQQYIAVELTTT